MKIYTTSRFNSKYKNLLKKDPQLGKIIDQKLTLFQQNPSYPSLRLHKLSSRKIDEWSISLKSNLRIVFQYVENGILATDIGSHDEVY